VSSGFLVAAGGDEDEFLYDDVPKAKKAKLETAAKAKPKAAKKVRSVFFFRRWGECSTLSEILILPVSF